MIMQNKGFTLVEVLIGLSIATVASVSIAYTIANTNKVADASKKTFIATSLAHEGLELTRALRDDAWLVDATPNDRADWANTICDEGLGEINSEIILGSDTTGFTRQVSVNCNERNGAESQFIEVASKVEWDPPRGVRKAVEIKERLYNWYTPTP